MMQFLKRLILSRLQPNCIFCESPPPQNSDFDDLTVEENHALLRLIFCGDDEHEQTNTAGFHKFFWKCLIGKEKADGILEKSVVKTEIHDDNDVDTREELWSSSGEKKERKEENQLSIPPVCHGCFRNICEIRKLHGELEKTQLLLIHHLETLQNSVIKSSHHNGNPAISSDSTTVDSMEAQESKKNIREFQQMITSQRERALKIPTVVIEKFQGSLPITLNYRPAGNFKTGSDNGARNVTNVCASQWRRSAVWKYFIPMNTERGRCAACNLCRPRRIFKTTRGNTSTLIRHLQTAHPTKSRCLIQRNPAGLMSFDRIQSHTPAPLHTAHGKLSDKSPKDIFTGSRKSGNDDLNDHLLSTFPKLERETDPSDDSDDDEAEAVPSPQSYCREGEDESCKSENDAESSPYSHSDVTENTSVDMSSPKMGPVGQVGNHNFKPRKNSFFKRKARSMVWKYFTASPDRKFAKCDLCDTETIIKTPTGVTSSLMRHLNTLHSSRNCFSAKSASIKSLKRIRANESEAEEEVEEEESRFVKGNTHEFKHHSLVGAKSEGDKFEVTSSEDEADIDSTAKGNNIIRTNNQKEKGRKFTSAVWKYFVPSTDRQTAQCKLCKDKTIMKIKSGTTSSLRRHLQSIHCLEMNAENGVEDYINSMRITRLHEVKLEGEGDNDDDSVSNSLRDRADAKSSRRRTSMVWKYFTQSADKQSAKCNLCKNKETIMKTPRGTTSALSRHIQYLHPSEHRLEEKICKVKDLMPEPEISQPQNNSVVEMKEDALQELPLPTTANINSKRRLTSGTWRYFTPTPDRTSARCHLCRKLLKTPRGTTSSLARHLQTFHSRKAPLLTIQRRIRPSYNSVSQQASRILQAAKLRRGLLSKNPSRFEKRCVVLGNAEGKEGMARNVTTVKVFSRVWKYFTPSLDRNFAQCNLCEKIMKTTNKSTSALWRHLEDIHSEMVVSTCQNENEESRSTGSEPEENGDEETKNTRVDPPDDATYSVARLRSSVWKYFNPAFDRGSATCKLCKDETIMKVIRGSTSSLKRHLYRIHGKTIPSVTDIRSDPDAISTPFTGTITYKSFGRPVQYHRIYTCQFCSKIFVAEADLNSHRQNHLENKIQDKDDICYWDKKTCTVCNESFMQSELYEHLLTHEKEGSDKPFMCLKEDCGRKFEFEDNLKIHQEIDHDDETSPDILSRVNKCELCNMCYSSSSLLKLHMRKIHKEVLSSLLRCPVCAQVFVCIENLVSHMHIHDNEDFQTCFLCKKNLPDRSQLLLHIQVVHGTVVARDCEVCGEHFEDLHLHQVHLRNAHKKAESFICSFCGHMAYFIQHHAKHEAIHEPGFPCEDCKEVFRRADLLFTHRVKMHVTAKELCDICGKGYSTRHKMQMHQKVVHFKEGHKCTLCDKCCPSKGTLATHMSQRHSEERPFLCEICCGSYKTASDLQRHQVIHSKKFDCKICGRKFSRRRDLDRHSGMHSESTFACEFCGYKFHSIISMRKHEKTYHTGENPLPLYPPQKVRNACKRWKDKDGNVIHAKNA